jgi:DNA mismatch endonuclease (patch repair protein)
MTPSISLLSGKIKSSFMKNLYRNEHMAKTKSKNSKVELLVFSFLRRNMIHFQKHYKGAPGSPDIALPRKKRAVFIDGDFWHGHDYDRRQTQLKPFWKTKIIKNMERDKRVNSELQENGWKIIRIWESDLSRKSTREITFEKLLLEKVLKQIKSEIPSGLKGDEYFEYFTADQILKDFDLSTDEILEGLVGGGNDGGIDGIFIFANEALIQDEETNFSTLNNGYALDIYIIQSKTSAGFSQDALTKLVASLPELLNLLFASFRTNKHSEGCC